MQSKAKDDKYLYIKDLFEIHKWKNPLLPFIFHTDLVENRHYGHGNWHESLEILYVLEGSGYILCDSKKYDMNIGDIIVINSNEVHRITSDSHLKYHCFIIGTSFCLENGIDITKLKYSTKIRDRRAAELLLGVVNEINDESKAFSASAIRSCALSLLVYFCRFYSESIDKTKANSQSDTVRKGLEYINNNFSQQLTLESISKITGISKYHFLREFKQYTGYTVITYINTLRCEYAKRLLLNTSFSISDVAIKCGYENLSYFTRTFKRYTGTLPSHFSQTVPEKNLSAPK